MGPDGWSEILYNAGDSPVGSQAIAQALVDARVKTLVDDAVIHHVRVSLVGSASPSFRFPPVGNQGAVTAVRDLGRTTVNVNVYTTLGTRRTLQLHGQPDSDVVYNNTGIPQLVAKGRVITYLTYLRNNQFAIRAVAQRAAARLGPIIDDITIANDVVTVTVPTVGFSKGQKIRISGATGTRARQYNGVWKIASLIAGPPTQFTFTTRRNLDALAVYDKGSAQLRSADLNGYTYPTIASFDSFVSFGGRKTGRPTDSPVGKRSSKR
jgi:hypothetical protein